MFITVEEMRTAIYEHVMDDISANDDATVQQCIEAAVSEMKSYLASRYDVAAIFAATGNDRDPLILEDTKVIAVWNLIRLSNSKLIYKQRSEEHTSELQSRENLVCRLLLEKKK